MPAAAGGQASSAAAGGQASTAGYYSTSAAFLEALAEAGVSYVFANLGSDHPGLIEAYAQAKAQGLQDAYPRLIICPHEMVALSAAHAYASVTRQPQAVIVHVDGGTQNLGGEVSNAMRGHIPVLIFAGASPYTLDGELPGSRNEFIHWIQDARDQRGILRGFVKYDNEIRTGRNVKQLVHRALQIARSDPAGPVYLVGPREVMEEPLEPYTVDPAQFRPIEPAALTAAVTREIATALARARHPLIVTSYLGRNPDAVPVLVELAELLGIGVLESAAFCVNFPGDHPLHLRLPVHHHRTEPGAGPGRRHPGRRQPRAVDPGHQPARAGRRHLRHRRRPAQTHDSHVADRRAPLRRRRLQGGPGADRPARSG